MSRTVIEIDIPEANLDLVDFPYRYYLLENTDTLYRDVNYEKQRIYVYE